MAFEHDCVIIIASMAGDISWPILAGHHCNMVYYVC